ncbi:glucosaminidase domain-containing protein [Agarivorans sp. TSD2052]|uniref:glucosaminidase domain-containing protein n=1 Tax=Agarivorans sp. TSD2052 TaxID=2937286 RepID=UPI00200F3668|nr:glucosaminidase domain-containing protein [Agarivorans sp. TSD2052]UPW20535.1 glucosaminidase domain-containing protein [Agarivorans sp. TSD2052]
MKKLLISGWLASLLLACEQAPTQPDEALTAIPLPALNEVADVKQKKQLFTDFILPLIEASNQQILDQRSQLFAIKTQSTKGKLSDKQIEQLNGLAAQYRVEAKLDATEKLKQLEARVDVIPPALVLAQAANESAWGTSRFAREGNNLFGQWCYQKGCGLVPLSRIDGAHHEVRKFDNVYQSVNAYMQNLNSHPAYRDFQISRQLARKTGQLDAIKLASHLTSYSERGQAYVEELQQMMRVNSSLWPTTISVSAS